MSVCIYKFILFQASLSLFLLQQFIYGWTISNFTTLYSNPTTNTLVSDFVFDAEAEIFYLSGFTSSTLDGVKPFNDTKYDVFVTKLALNGTVIWTRMFGGSTNQRSYDMAFSKESELLFVTGIPWQCELFENLGRGCFTALVCLNARNGSVNWMAAQDWTAWQQPIAIVLVEQNKTVAVTSLHSETGSLNIYSFDGKLIKRTPLGAAIRLRGLSYDSTRGNYWVTGIWLGPNIFSVWKLDAGGNLLWYKWYGNSTFITKGVSLHIDEPAGKVYLGGLAERDFYNSGVAPFNRNAFLVLNTEGKVLQSNAFGPGGLLARLEPYQNMFFAVQCVEADWYTYNPNCVLFNITLDGVPSDSVQINSFVARTIVYRDRLYLVESWFSIGYRLRYLTLDSTPFSSDSSIVPTSTIITASAVAANETRMSSNGFAFSFNFPPGSSIAATKVKTTSSQYTEVTSVQTSLFSFLSFLSYDASLGVIAGLIGVTILCFICLVVKCRKTNLKKTKLRSEPPKTGSDKNTTYFNTSSLSTNMSSSSSTNYSSMTLVQTETGIYIPGFLKFAPTMAFRAETVLAEGGMGRILIAEAFVPSLQVFGNKIAVKESLVQTVNQRQLDAFYQEVSVMYALQKHRNIAKLLGYCDEPLSIIMKYYPLGSLFQWINNRDRTGRPMTPNKRICIAFMYDVAFGIKSMHDSMIAHCDIKPQNIIVDLDTQRRPFCVLTDFGISRILSNDQLLVKEFRTVNLKGASVAYAAPEVLMRIFQKQQPPSLMPPKPNEVLAGDVYSFSIVLLEIMQRKMTSIRPYT